MKAPGDMLRSGADSGLPVTNPAVTARELANMTVSEKDNGPCMTLHCSPYNHDGK